MKPLVNTEKMKCPICGKDMECVHINFDKSQQGIKFTEPLKVIYCCDKFNGDDHSVRMEILQREPEVKEANQ